MAQGREVGPVLTAARLAAAARWLGVGSFVAVLAGATVIASLRSFDDFGGFAGAGYAIGGAAILVAAGAALGAVGLAIAARRVRRGLPERTGPGGEGVGIWLGAVALAGTAGLGWLLLRTGPDDFRRRQLMLGARPTETLLALVTDPDMVLARAAIVELGDREEVAGVRPLLQRLTHPELGTDAANALLRIGEDAVPLCFEALLQDDPAARVAIRRVLAEFARSGFVDGTYLEARLASDAAPVRRAAAWACMAIGDDLRQYLVDALDDPDPDVQLAAALGLCASPDARARWPLIPQILRRQPGSPLSALHAADPDIRRAGLRALPNLGLAPAEVVAAVMERADDPELPELLRTTIANLPEAQLGELEILLIVGLRHDRSRAVAARALGWLGPNLSTDGWNALSQALAAPDVPRLDTRHEMAEGWATNTERFVDDGARGSVIWAILQCGSPAQVTAALTPLLADGEPRHRLAAATAIADRGDAEAFEHLVVPALVDLLPTLENGPCKHAMTILQRRPQLAQRADRALSVLAEDPRRPHHVRMHARAMLTEMRDPTTAPPAPVAGGK